MSHENVEIVRGLYEAWNRAGGVPPWSSIDPDIEVDFTGGLLKGRYRGHAGIAEALASFWGEFDEARIDVENFRARGDVVLVSLRYFARGKASGALLARSAMGYFS